MSYDAQETSVKGGRPYFLFLLTDGSVDGTARLTSHAENLTRDVGSGDQEWTASPVETSRFEQNGNIEKQELKLAFPLSDTFARRFLDPRSGTTSVTVWRGHLTDLDDETRVIWKGRIVDAEPTSDERIELICESIYTSLRRSGCRTRVQRTCMWAVYTEGCTLDKADFEVEATVTAAASGGLGISSPEAAADPGDYVNGFIDWNGATATITHQSGASLTLLNEIPGLVDYVNDVGPADVLLYPGCNLGKVRCDRFDNLLNRLAFDFLPKQNPFNSSIA